MIAESKLKEILHKNEAEKQKNAVVWVLAIIGAIAGIAAIAYAVFRFVTPDYLEDFEDDFDDDFDDYFEDEELDVYRQIAPEAYTDEQIEVFRDILYTLRPEEVEEWLISLEKREINLPLILRQEAIELIP